MTKEEIKRLFAAQYRKELEAMQTDLKFWESDLGVPGFDVEEARQRLRRDVRGHQHAIEIPEAADS